MTIMHIPSAAPFIPTTYSEAAVAACVACARYDRADGGERLTGTVRMR